MDLTTLAHHLLVLLSPIIAQGALTKVGEETTDHVAALFGRARSALQQRFQGNRQAESALTVYEEEPDDPKSQERVVRHIVTHFRCRVDRTRARVAGGAGDTGATTTGTHDHHQ